MSDKIIQMPNSEFNRIIQSTKDDILREIEDEIIKQLPEMECPQCKHKGMWHREGFRSASDFCVRCGYEDGYNTYY